MARGPVDIKDLNKEKLGQMSFSDLISLLPPEVQHDVNTRITEDKDFMKQMVDTKSILTPEKAVLARAKFLSILNSLVAEKRGDVRATVLSLIKKVKFMDEEN